MKKRHLVGMLVPMLLSGAGAAWAALETRAVTGAVMNLQLGGTSLPVASLAGGSTYAPVLTEKTTGPTSPKKHLGPPQVDPVVAQVGLDLPPTLASWIDASWTGSAQPKDGSITLCDSNLRPIEERQLSSTALTEVAFPALDARSKEVGRLTLTLQPQSARTVSGSQCKGADAASKAKAKHWLPSNFRVDLTGLDTRGVVRIEPFSVKSTAQGASPRGQRAQSPAQIPDLRLTIARSKSEAFQSWHDDFVVEGNNGDDKEKAGAIVLLDATLSKELARISLEHVGVFGLAIDPANPAQVVVDLYVEVMRFSVPGSAKASAAKAARAR